VEQLEKAKDGLKTENEDLKAQVESLEATIAKNKNMVDEADGVMNRNIELWV
jgi:cell division septum initiation protein DivIVA